MKLSRRSLLRFIPAAAAVPLAAKIIPASSESAIDEVNRRKLTLVSGLRDREEFTDRYFLEYCRTNEKSNASA